MYSFYGGKPGNSFIIITTYGSVSEMVEKFKNGPNYTAVHYDEHVMINTVNKNDPDNGKLYRRGYDFTNDMGGAEYIGTIAGPSGNAPLLEMDTITEVNKKHAKEGYEERKSSGTYNITNSLIPGKTPNNTFNDEISWVCCSIRNENNEDTTAYIGFTIPYTVIDFESINVEPYAGSTYSDTSAAIRIDDTLHPFYEKWQLNIPKGIKGNSFQNLKIQTANENIKNYDGQADDINYERKVLTYDLYNYDKKKNGTFETLYLGDYNIIEDISLNEEGTFIIDYTHNDSTILENKIKWINSVSLDPNYGDFQINYNYGENYKESLDWIKNIDIQSNGDIIYTHTTVQDENELDEIKKYQTKDSTQIIWPTAFEVNSFGAIAVHWNNYENDTWQQIGRIKQINNFNLNEEGYITASWVAPFDPDVIINENNPIKWIESIDQNNGKIAITYNTLDENDQNEKEILGTMKSITNINIDIDRIENGVTVPGNGDITITYNTVNQNNQSEKDQLPNALKWIRELSIDDEDNTAELIWSDDEDDKRHRSPIKLIKNISIAQDPNANNAQKFKINWYNSNNDQFIGDPINNIIQMAINNQNHLLVRYSNPNIEQTITWENKNWTDIGEIKTYADYNPGDNNIQVGDWTGIGQIIDSGNGNKSIRFTLNTTQIISNDVTTITLNNGTLNASNTTDIITDYSLSGVGKVNIVKTFFGLDFYINTNIASSGTSSTNFINISLSNVTLSFS